MAGTLPGWTPPATLPDWTAPTAGVATVALLAAAAWAAGRRSQSRRLAGHVPTDQTAQAARQAADQAALRRWRASATTLTVLAAGIATATALNGMWHVFGDALGLHWPARIVLVGFLEIPLVTSAIRARVAILEGRPAGGDGAAVWVLALISAGLSAADTTSWLARALRFVVPLVAAWMWHQSLAADRRNTHTGNHHTTVEEPITWRWTPQRLAIRLGLADTTHPTNTDLDRARRLSRLTRARIRYAVLSTPTPRPLAWLTARPARRTIAAWRCQRHAYAAVEYLQLGTDPTITNTITTTVAAVVGFTDATDPTTLTHHQHNPWTTPTPTTQTRPPTDRVVDRVVEGPADRVATDRVVDRVVEGPADRVATDRVATDRVATDRVVEGPTDADILAAIRASGHVLSVWGIRTTYRVGSSRAARLFAQIHSPTSNIGADAHPFDTTSPSVNGNAIPHMQSLKGSSYDDSQNETCEGVQE